MTAPTGVVPWPIVLLAGVDHSEVTLAAAEATRSDLITSAAWVPIGRDYPDAVLPGGGDFTVVEHDGTYRDLLARTAAVTDHLLIVDSVSPLWSMLADEAALTLDERAAVQAFPVTPAGLEIPRDLWRDRGQRWHRFINVVRRHDGPVVLTAYLDEVALVNDTGDRTTTTRWEIQAEKNLARSVSAVLQYRGTGHPVVSGAAGVEGLADLDPRLSIDELWSRLGLGHTNPSRRHAALTPLGAAAERARLLLEIRDAADLAAVPREEVLAGWANSHNGQHINDADDLDELQRTRDALLRHVPAPADQASGGDA